MAVVIDNNKAMSRQQGQREADADSRCNNQIKTANDSEAEASKGGKDDCGY